MVRVSYEKLRIMMIKQRVEFKDFKIIFGFAPRTIKKLREDDVVDLKVLLEICEWFKCDIGDIMQVVIYHV